ncbi:MAG: hypothetical protein GY821_01300 [Gammaproteobacteria bacterium]|nr:hypothetical protein [Gammaproteobacteria bacterium]
MMKRGITSKNAIVRLRMVAVFSKLAQKGKLEDSAYIKELFPLCFKELTSDELKTLIANNTNDFNVIVSRAIFSTQDLKGDIKDIFSNDSNNISSALGKIANAAKEIGGGKNLTHLIKILLIAAQHHADNEAIVKKIGETIFDCCRDNAPADLKTVIQALGDDVDANIFAGQGTRAQIIKLVKDFLKQEDNDDYSDADVVKILPVAFPQGDDAETIVIALAGVVVDYIKGENDVTQLQAKRAIALLESYTGVDADYSFLYSVTKDTLSKCQGNHGQAKNEVLTTFSGVMADKIKKSVSKANIDEVITDFAEIDNEEGQNILCSDSYPWAKCYSDSILSLVERSQDDVFPVTVFNKVSEKANKLNDNLFPIMKLLANKIFAKYIMSGDANKFLKDCVNLFLQGYDLALMLLKDKKLENNVLYLGFHDDVLHYKERALNKVYMYIH